MQTLRKPKPSIKRLVAMMTDHDLDVIEQMEKYGGSFVAALAQAARRADSTNLAKIKEAFPEYWKQYSEMVDEGGR